MGAIFLFYSNFNRTFCVQTVGTLIKQRRMRRLIWVCTVFICPTKKDARLIWVNVKQSQVLFVKISLLTTKYIWQYIPFSRLNITDIEMYVNIYIQ